MAFNLSPDKPAVGFAIGGNSLISTPLNYTNYTGAYLPVIPGNRDVRSVEFYSGATIAAGNADFADSMYYSAFLLGANGNYRNVIVEDNLDALPRTAGKAWVRYINAIPDSSAVTVVSIAGSNESAPYAAVSGFKQVDAGQVSVLVNNGGSINATRNIAMEQYKVYTVLLSGLTNQSNPALAVQIKFITNGTISEQ